MKGVGERALGDLFAIISLHDVPNLPKFDIVYLFFVFLFDSATKLTKCTPCDQFI